MSADVENENKRSNNNRHYLQTGSIYGQGVLIRLSDRKLGVDESI